MIKKIFKLLTKQERKRLYMLFGAMVISGLIGAAGIVSIMPFLSLITNPNLIQDNRILSWLYIVLNFRSDSMFLIFIGIIVLIILVLTNLSALITNWGLFRFTYMRNFTISRRLLSKYIHQPYIFFLNKNTSELGKNILSEVNQVTSGVLVPLMQIFTNGVVAIFIFVMLILVEPLLTISIMVILGGAYVLIYKIVQKKINYIGQKRFEANAELYKVVNEAFSGIKQLKLLGYEQYFINSYSKSSYDTAKYGTKHHIISQTPRYILEIIAFSGVILIILYLLIADKVAWNGRGIQDILPIIALFTFAAYRLLPTLQTIFVGFTQISFNAYSLESLCKDMQSFDVKSDQLISYNNKIKPLRLQKDLNLEDITFNYPGTIIPVINKLNIKIRANSSVAFVGETGVGKTTIADIILGLLRPDKGRIIVDDIEINEDNLQQWQHNLGYIPQDIYLRDDTIIRNIAFGISDGNIDLDAVERCARVANIHNFIVEQLPDGYQTVVGERGVRLSGGQRQRIGIARALYNNPGVLVLDEATSALDGATEREVFTAIKNISKTKTLIIIAHRLTTIKDCDVIYVLKNGSIISTGKYDDLIKTNKNFRKIAGLKPQ